MANAALALTFSDKIEAFLGVKPSQEDDRQLQETLPRLVRMERAVEDNPRREERG